MWLLCEGFKLFLGCFDFCLFDVWVNIDETFCSYISITNQSSSSLPCNNIATDEPDQMLTALIAYTILESPWSSLGQSRDAPSEVHGDSKISLDRAFAVHTQRMKSCYNENMDTKWITSQYVRLTECLCNAFSYELTPLCDICDDVSCNACTHGKCA